MYFLDTPYSLYLELSANLSVILEKELGQIEAEEHDAYSLFMYAVRSQVTRDYYLRRLRIFLNYISLLPGGTMKEGYNLFASKILLLRL